MLLLIVAAALVAIEAIGMGASCARRCAYTESRTGAPKGSAASRSLDGLANEPWPGVQRKLTHEFSFSAIDSKSVAEKPLFLYTSS